LVNTPVGWKRTNLALTLLNYSQTRRAPTLSHGMSPSMCDLAELCRGGSVTDDDVELCALPCQSWNLLCPRGK